MSERKRVEVNEEAMRQIMANDKQEYLIKPVVKEPELPVSQTVEPAPEIESEIIQDMEDPEPEIENAKTQKKKRNPKPNFAEIFLKEAKIKDRRQIYISKEAYDKISRYLRYIGEGNVSLVSYVDNILFHHMDEYRDTINDLYNKNISTSL